MATSEDRQRDTTSPTRLLAERLLGSAFIEPTELMQEVPERLGRYEVVRPLGKGASSEVYLAHDPAVEREVAIKVLLGVDSDPARFRREMQVLAALQDPGIVQIFDAGHHAGRPYFVMEYLGDRCLAEAGLPWRDQVRLLEQVALACHAAHEQGIVHRDLKPLNVLVADERAVVVDFGVAKLLHEPGGGTRVGAAVGTPAYMAPEQVRGDAEVDARCDVYALGVMLYEALTGRPPFRGETFGELATRIAAEAPRPPHEVSDVPEALGAIALTALAKDPEDRFPSARAFAGALQAWRVGGEEEPQGVRDGWVRSPRRVAGWVVVLVALALGLTAILQRERPSPSPLNTQSPGPAPSVVHVTPADDAKADDPGADDPAADDPAADDPGAAVAAEMDKIADWERLPRELDARVPSDDLRPSLQRLRALLKQELPVEVQQQALTALARAKHDLGRRREAAADLDRALALTSTATAEARLERGLIRWEEHLDALLAMDSEEADRLRRAVVDDLRPALTGSLAPGRRALGEGLLELALAWRGRDFQALLPKEPGAEGPNSPPPDQVLLLRGQIQCLAGDLAAAAETLRGAQSTRSRTAAVAATLAIVYLTRSPSAAPLGSDWDRMRAAVGAGFTALHAQPDAPDVQRVFAQVVRLWLLRWHQTGQPRAQMTASTRQALRQTDRVLVPLLAGGPDVVTARVANLCAHLFRTTLDPTQEAQSLLEDATEQLLDVTQGEEHGPQPWLSLAHAELVRVWLRTLRGEPAVVERQRLETVLANARRWFPDSPELTLLVQLATQQRGPR